MASPAPPIEESRTQPWLPALADEILEEILVRVPTPEALARASAACTSFRSIITARSFLRRYRKLHRPPLLGLLIDTEAGFRPAQAPHPSAPLARALVAAADFDYGSFVPEPNQSWLNPWQARDVRDGRVLLDCTGQFDFGAVFTNLAVCDPLSRRSVLLPPIPGDMSMNVQQDPVVQVQPILAPAGEDEDTTLFKVICTAHYKTKLVAFVFSSVTSQWCIAASTSWSSLGTVKPTRRKCLSRFNYVHGCFYWLSVWRDKLLVLDTCSMEFSTVDTLTGYHSQLINQPGRSRRVSTVIEGTKGALEMCTLVDNYSPTSYYLYQTAQQNNGESSNEWQLKNIIPLPRRCFYGIAGAAEGFLFLRGVREDQWDDISHGVIFEDKDVDFFSLEVKTSELKKMFRKTYTNRPNRVYPYFGYPPLFSEPSL